MRIGDETWRRRPGVLRKEELPTERVQHIAGLIEFYEHDVSAS